MKVRDIELKNWFDATMILLIIGSGCFFFTSVLCGETFIGEDGAEMVFIPAGDFIMGNNNGLFNEQPEHTVYIDGFYMDIYEVTNALYQDFIVATGHPQPAFWDDDRFNDPTQPVVGVTWQDAVAYAIWAGKRLPTEAEWEKAARGGLVGKKYPWGDAALDGTQCNFADVNANVSWADNSIDDGYEYPAPVGSYPSTGEGLFDMAGNVFEWCSDWHDDYYYWYSPAQNPQGPSSGDGRAVRGGSWYDTINNLLVSDRSNATPTTAYNHIGFRCVTNSLPDYDEDEDEGSD